MTTQAQALLRIADINPVEFRKGCVLLSYADIAANQRLWDDLDPSKHIVLSVSPYWVSTDDGFLFPVDDAADLSRYL